MTANPVRASSITLEVTDRIRESAHVMSLRLRAVEGDLPGFLPGQHLPLQLGLPGRPLATYTISSDPADRGSYRISVKLEPGGRGGSRHLHDVEVGTRLTAQAPRDRFVLEDDDRPVLLLTGGIGITPALAMAHHLARQPDRPVIFLHACRSAADLCFAEEVASLAAKAPNIRAETVLAEATADEAAGRHIGLIDRISCAGCCRRMPGASISAGRMVS